MNHTSAFAEPYGREAFSRATAAHDHFVAIQKEPTNLAIGKRDGLLATLGHLQKAVAAPMVGHGDRSRAQHIARAARSRQQVEGEGEQAKILASADAEARWVKKGKQSFIGYRGHTVMDSEDGYVEHVQVHPPKEAEINKLL